MKFDGLGKPLLIAFGAALLFYVGFYSLDAHLRVRKGPWQVTFTSDGTNAPSLRINEPKLGIANVRKVCERGIRAMTRSGRKFSGCGCR